MCYIVSYIESVVGDIPRPARFLFVAHRRITAVSRSELEGIERSPLDVKCVGLDVDTTGVCYYAMNLTQVVL